MHILHNRYEGDVEELENQIQEKQREVEYYKSELKRQ